MAKTNKETATTASGATPPVTPPAPPAGEQGKDETSTTTQGAAPPVAPASKQEKDKANAAPVEPKVSDAVVKVGKGLLKSNPGLQVVYMTADGNGFYLESDAASHARTLNNKAVTPVKRD